MGSFFVWRLNPELQPSSTSEEVKDKCGYCGMGNAPKTCYICDEGNFCGDLRTTEHTTANDLYHDVIRGRIPRNPLVLKEYYFGNCKELEHQEGLFRLYKTLFTVFRIPPSMLHKWQKSKRIHDNSVTLFNEEPKPVPREQFLFLRDNPNLFSEDRSETLNEHAFARTGIIGLFSAREEE
ncbi:unnamed protein product [Clonostachys byssicola]|uniref:Uncharacterized protein n=1 Tax=Clonostachys byssicola TaxID=160290 RepID=A0A9N9Y9E3_9HYPO|nr:unnamed protein product [Clonostachys byssicola]